MDCNAHKFDFDDLLIVPTTTTKITSRYKGITLPKQLPLMTAPMDTVVDLTNYKEFLDRGITVCLPRTNDKLTKIYQSIYQLPDIDFNRTKDSIKYYTDNIFASIGFEDIHFLCNQVPDIVKRIPNVLIDVANGHMELIIKYVKMLKDIHPEIKIMVGNIANPKTYEWYAEHFGLIDYIRVGIGNGGGCLTTKQSGVGYPMASLIYEIRQIKKNMEKQLPDEKLPAIVADGGMKDYVDIIKALALGADFVMLGSIFNKSLESCAQNYYYGIKIGKKRAEKLFKKGKKVKKYFRGMSTKEAQKAMGKTQIKTSEGVVRYRQVEYTLDKWTENFEHYLRNAMSYAGCETLERFIGGANTILITKSGYDRFNK